MGLSSWAQGYQSLCSGVIFRQMQKSIPLPLKAVQDLTSSVVQVTTLTWLSDTCMHTVLSCLVLHLLGIYSFSLQHYV